MQEALYWTERATRGNAAVNDEGKCRGCGRNAERVADGAADGCPVCLAFLDWITTAERRAAGPSTATESES